MPPPVVPAPLLMKTLDPSSVLSPLDNNTLPELPPDESPDDSVRSPDCRPLPVEIKTCPDLPSTLSAVRPRTRPPSPPTAAETPAISETLPATVDVDVPPETSISPPILPSAFPPSITTDPPRAIEAATPTAIEIEPLELLEPSPLFNNKSPPVSPVPPAIETTPP